MTGKPKAFGFIAGGLTLALLLAQVSNVIDTKFLPVVLVLIFLGFAAVMMTRLLPALLALPLMGMAFGLAAGFEPGKLFGPVLTDGAGKLSGVMVLLMMGGILAELVNRAGITKNVVTAAAELGGEKPFVLGLVLCLASELLFVVLGGLGSIIMVGSVLLPVLISAGYRPIGAGLLFLMTISFGGILNMANWALYLDKNTWSPPAAAAGAVASACPPTAGGLVAPAIGDIMPFAVLFFLIANALLIGMVFMESKRRDVRYLAANPIPEKEDQGWLLGPLAYLTPVLPILLVGTPLILQRLGVVFPVGAWYANFPPVLAFTIAILFGFIATWKPNHLQVLTASLIEGVQAMAPVLVLIMGLGILLTVTMDDLIKCPMAGALKSIFPTTLVGYLALFAVLAPLSLYRGPLNLFGMGAGVFLVLAGSGLVAPAMALVVLFLTVGQIQGACDPTNTHNVWVANFLKVDVNDLLKASLLKVWALAIVGLIVGSLMVGLKF